MFKVSLHKYFFLAKDSHDNSTIKVAKKNTVHSFDNDFRDSTHPVKNSNRQSFFPYKINQGICFSSLTLIFSGKFLQIFSWTWRQGSISSIFDEKEVRSCLVLAVVVHFIEPKLQLSLCWAAEWRQFQIGQSEVTLAST